MIPLVGKCPKQDLKLLVPLSMYAYTNAMVQSHLQQQQKKRGFMGYPTKITLLCDLFVSKESKKQKKRG